MRDGEERSSLPPQIGDSVDAGMVLALSRRPSNVTPLTRAVAILRTALRRVWLQPEGPRARLTGVILNEIAASGTAPNPIVMPLVNAARAIDQMTPRPLPPLPSEAPGPSVATVAGTAIVPDIGTDAAPEPEDSDVPPARPMSLVAQHAETIRRLLGEENGAGNDVAALDRLAEGLRTTPAGDRRRVKRLPLMAAATVTNVHGSFSTHTLDVSIAGVQLDAVTCELDPGERIDIEIEGLPILIGRVVANSREGVHVAFCQTTPFNRAALDQLPGRIETVARANETQTEEAAALAAAMSHAFAAALAWGTVTADALFAQSGLGDAHGRPVDLETQAFYRDMLMPLLAPVAGREGVLYGLAATSEGTVPVTTARAGEMTGAHFGRGARWHTRRALRNRAGPIVQIYREDGAWNRVPPTARNGEVETLLIRDVSAPVVVAGRHWGCVRLGYADFVWRPEKTGRSH